MTREEQLLDVARWIARYFDRHPSIGPQDDILIRRTLDRILMEYEDIEPLADADRRAWRARRELQHAMVR